MHFLCWKRTPRHKREVCTYVAGWLAGLVGRWVGGSLAWVGVAVTQRKLFPFGGEMQGTLAGDSDRSQISLSEKVPRLPALQFHSDWRRNGERKNKGGVAGGRGGLGGETEREKKWRMKRGRMETHRERRDGSRGGDSSRGTDRQTDWNEFARTDFNFFC